MCMCVFIDYKPLLDHSFSQVGWSELIHAYYEQGCSDVLSPYHSFLDALELLPHQLPGEIYFYSPK